MVSILGELIKIDWVIVMKEFLYYVCIFVEVFIDEEFFETISFENEWEGI